MHERADTPAMRNMLFTIARASQSMIEIRLPRLSRRSGASEYETSRMVYTADNCRWVDLKINSAGAVMDIRLTDEGWAMIGGKPEWLKEGPA